MITVPNLKDKTVKEAEDLLSEKSLKIKVIDSVFNPKNKKGVIVDQNPPKDFQVKSNRTVYVSINAFQPPKVSFPNIKDVSLRQAKAILQSIGLELGNTIYVPDIAKNAVLGASYLGREIAAGTMISYGSKIDLKLGDGGTGKKIELPDLSGLTITEARNILAENSLILSAILFDNENDDTLTAKIYLQKPAPGTIVSAGSPIDIYLSENDNNN